MDEMTRIDIFFWIGDNESDERESSINAEGNMIVIALEKDKTVLNDMTAGWVKAHVTEFGEEPSLFDGI